MATHKNQLCYHNKQKHTKKSYDFDVPGKILLWTQQPHLCKVN